MLQLFKNKFILAYLLLYLLSLAFLVRAGHSVGEGLLGLLILGVGFSALAWRLCKGAVPLPVNTEPTRNEMLTVLACVVLVMLYLMLGAHGLNQFLPAALTASLRGMYTFTMVKKLAVFVIIPYMALRYGFGYCWRDFGLSAQALRSHWKVIVGMSLAVLLLNYFLGSAAAPIRRGEFSARQLLIATPLCFVWLIFEVGLVEEFFFRAVLLERLAAWLRSDLSGVVVMALVFGLAHAPGYVLRGAGAVEAVGAHPSIFEAAAYAIVIVSATGFFFAVIWTRTKNLWALMLIHAATDLLPQLAEFMRVWQVR